MGILALIDAWKDTKENADRLKAEELALRKKICQELLVGKAEGAMTKTISNYKVTATAKLNRRIDIPALEAIWRDLTLLDQEAIIYKPALVMAQYKTLHESSLLHSAVVTAPGTPSLAIKEMTDGD